MPRHIEQLNENITPASGDWLWIVDVDAGATDQDRKLSVGKLALLAAANTFAEIVTASKGIAFPATPVASADAHTLDDYEEGVWTPALSYVSPGTLEVTYLDQIGYYIKVGNMVNIWGDLRLSGFTKGTASGSPIISGLPFPSKNVIFARSQVTINVYNQIFTTQPSASIFANSSNIELIRLVSNGASVALDDPDADSMFFFSCVYQV